MGQAWIYNSWLENMPKKVPRLSIQNDSTQKNQKRFRKQYSTESMAAAFELMAKEPSDTKVFKLLSARRFDVVPPKNTIRNWRNLGYKQPSDIRKSGPPPYLSQDDLEELAKGASTLPQSQKWS